MCYRFVYRIARALLRENTTILLNSLLPNPNLPHRHHFWNTVSAMAEKMRTLLPLLLLGIIFTVVPVSHAHTWMFSKGRAWMQASLDKPFRERILTGGQGTHAQFGPDQHVVVRWAASHNNTFSLAVVSAADQDWFFHEDFYTMLDDYIDSAPVGANEAVEKPRYHGAAGNCVYLNEATNTACAGGNCVKDLFAREVPTTETDTCTSFMCVRESVSVWQVGGQQCNACGFRPI